MNCFPPFSNSKPASSSFFSFFLYVCSASPSMLCVTVMFSDVKTSSVWTDSYFTGSETGCKISLSSQKSFICLFLLPLPPFQCPHPYLFLSPLFCFTLRRTRLFSLIDSLWPPVMPVKDHGNTPCMSSVSFWHSRNPAYFGNVFSFFLQKQLKLQLMILFMN